GRAQWAGVDGAECDAVQPGGEQLRVLFATRGQGEVCGPGVPARKAPLGLAVAGEVELEAQAGLPIISGRPERRDRLALSITPPARTRCPGRTQTRPTAACAPSGLRASLTAARTRLAACAVPATAVAARTARSCVGGRASTAW